MPIDQTTDLAAPAHSDTVRRKSFYRSFIQFLFSNIGLIIIVAAYSIGGAFLFILLEQYIELQNCQQGNLLENISVTNLSETMYSYVILTDNDTATTHAQIADYLKNFTKDIYQRRSVLRYAGQDCTTSSAWSFPSALLFTIIVITSIGYGHTTPVSWEGQITCICYALIGIPIFLICLANMSAVLGDVFRFMYSSLLHCCCCVCRVYYRNRRRRRHRQDGRVKKEKLENRNVVDYTGTTTMDPGWPEATRRSRGMLVFDDENDVYDAKNDGDNNYDDDDDDELDENRNDIWNRMENRVPFGVVILIIAAYIYLGAFMFTRFESWTMTQSVYFCFVTLATIGFGDFVPGITSSSTSGLRFLLASIYILIGLAILAMCIDLIKEGIVDKFRWFGNKLGIVADDDEQNREDRSKYVEFEYDTSGQQQFQTKRNEDNQILFTKVYPNQSSVGSPVRDNNSPDGTWLEDIPDKYKTEITNIRNKKEVSNDKDGKH